MKLFVLKFFSSNEFLLKTVFAMKYFLNVQKMCNNLLFCFWFTLCSCIFFNFLECIFLLFSLIFIFSTEIQWHQTCMLKSVNYTGSNGNKVLNPNRQHFHLYLLYIMNWNITNQSERKKFIECIYLVYLFLNEHFLCNTKQYFVSFKSENKEKYFYFQFFVYFNLLWWTDSIIWTNNSIQECWMPLRSKIIILTKTFTNKFNNNSFWVTLTVRIRFSNASLLYSIPKSVLILFSFIFSRKICIRLDFAI